MVRDASAVKAADLDLVSVWSDQIREVRNVLHWAAAVPSVPNTCDKVAVLLMAASANLALLNKVRLST